MKLRRGEIVLVALAVAAALAAWIAPSKSHSGDHLRIMNIVMGHLGPVDPATLREEFKALKAQNVDAVTIDLFWGLIEQQKDHPNWDYFKEVFSAARDAGLKIIPEFSFHECGFNVGDSVVIPLPPWVWQLTTDMKFVDSNNFTTDETIAFGIPEAYERFQKFMESFADNFKQFAADIPAIYVLQGPAGELRYPSYQEKAGWKYPNVGTFQAYSERSKTSFRGFLQEKYKTIEKLNEAWQVSYKSFSEAQPPGEEPKSFFAKTVKTPYGQDFMTWYQKGLEDHTDKMFTIAESAFKAPENPFSRVKLLGKIGGIHWLYGDPEAPHAAEGTAGYFDYKGIFRVFQKHTAGLTFTCLEMKDRDFILDKDKNKTFDYSRPEELIKKIAELAKNFDVLLLGENALSLRGSDEATYAQIRKILIENNFAGFTLLRIEDLVDHNGKPRPHVSNLYNKYLANVPRNPLPPSTNPTNSGDSLDSAAAACLRDLTAL